MARARPSLGLVNDWVGPRNQSTSPDLWGAGRRCTETGPPRLARNLEQLGRDALSPPRGVWLQQHGSDEGVVVSFIPWPVRVFAWVTRDYLVAVFVVSGLACAAAAVLLRRLVAHDYGQAVAQRAVWFFLIFPNAYSCTSDTRNRSSWRSCSLRSSQRVANAGGWPAYPFAISSQSSGVGVKASV